MAGGKLLSTCQPASPGSSCDGKRIGNVPRSLRGCQRPGPTSWSNAWCRTGVLAALENGSCPYTPKRITGFVQVVGSASSQPVSRHKIVQLWSASSSGKARGIFTKPSRMNCLICASLSMVHKIVRQAISHTVDPGRRIRRPTPQERPDWWSFSLQLQ
jgi:hypothetical protein